MDGGLVAGLVVAAFLLFVIPALIDFVRRPETRNRAWETVIGFGLFIILVQLFKYVVLPLLSVEWPKMSDTTVIIILLFVIIGLLATIADKLNKGG